MSQSAQVVADHYRRRALGDVILGALKETGKDVEHLTPDDLAPVDAAYRPAKVPRDVFMYFIHEGKVRAPAGAVELIERIR